MAITGDIKALYAYYRLSDHASTSLTLKSKALIDPVYFEGHMDFSFKSCDFNASFYFGVEGERLPEDPREEEVFPPYGSNGINFDSCTINEYFEIVENCVVVFVNCTINKAFKLSQGCKAEFINCTILENIDMDSFCDVRFIRCTFPSFAYKVKAENSCKLHFNDCVYTTYTEYFLQLSEDSSGTLSNREEKPTIESAKEIFIVNDRSVLYLYNFNELLSSTTVISSNLSKVKVKDITLINGATAAITSKESEVFLDRVETLSGVLGIDAEDSVLRINLCDNIVGDTTAIKAVNSTINVSNFTAINSTSGSTIEGENSSCNINNGGTIESAEAYALHLSGLSTSNVSHIAETIKGSQGAIYAADEAEVFVTDTLLIEGEDTAVHLSGGSVKVSNSPRIEGAKKGVLSTGGYFQGFNIAEGIFGGSEEALALTDTIYDIKDVQQIYSESSSALSFVSGRGILRDINTISSESGTTIQGILDDPGSFIATNISQISSEEGNIVSILGSDKDSFVRFHAIAQMSTSSAPEDAIKIAGVGRIELDDITSIQADSAGQYIVRLEGVAPGYGVIKVLDCKTIEGQDCRGGLVILNALFADVVGTKDSCAITLGTGLTYAFGAINTQLLLKNYSEISVSDGEADSFYAYTLALPACEMKILNVESIKSKKGHAINLANNGNISFVDIARVEVEEDAAVIYGYGEGIYSFHGSKIEMVIAAAKEENTALELFGFTGKLDTRKIRVEKGKTILNQVILTARSSTFKDLDATSSGGHIYSSSFNLNEAFICTDSALYFFDSVITSTGKGVCTNSSLTFEVSTISTEEGEFTGMNSSTLIGNNSSFDCQAITGFMAVELNACSGSSDFDCQGVIINGSNLTGEITSSGYSARSGLLVNGSYLAEVIGTQNTAIFLNGTHSLEGLTVGDTSAVYINWGYFSKETTIGQGNAIVSNYGVLRDITGGSGNILIASKTTVNAVNFDEANAIIFNYCTPTSDGITLGDDSYLELNAISSPYMPVTLSDNSALVANTTSVKSLVIPETSAALTTNFYTKEIQVQGDLICSGGALDAYEGSGRMIATQRTPLNSTCTPQDVSAGILVRDEGARSQVLIWSEKTALQMGDNGARTDARMYAVSGAARVVGPMAILQGIYTNDAYCKVEGLIAERKAPQGNVYDQAQKSITRIAGDNLEDTAGGEAKRTSAKILDEATEEATRKAKNILDDASVDATRKAAETISDEAGGDAFRTAGGSIIDIADVDASRAAPNGTISDAAGSISHDPPV